MGSSGSESNGLGNNGIESNGIGTKCSILRHAYNVTFGTGAFIFRRHCFSDTSIR
jgi:hypothetical protein